MNIYYKVIISVFFCSLVAIFIRWLFNIEREIKKEKIIKKYYFEALKKEKEEEEVRNKELNNKHH